MDAMATNILNFDTKQFYNYLVKHKYFETDYTPIKPPSTNQQSRPTLGNYAGIVVVRKKAAYDKPNQTKERKKLSPAKIKAKNEAVYKKAEKNFPKLALQIQQNPTMDCLTFTTNAVAQVLNIFGQYQAAAIVDLLGLLFDFIHKNFL